MKQLLVITAFILGLGAAHASCVGTTKKTADKPHKVESTKKTPAKKKPPKKVVHQPKKHETHPHPHGAHPHDEAAHHHHSHPHPHLDGPDGHHHPY